MLAETSLDLKPPGIDVVSPKKVFILVSFVSQPCPLFMDDGHCQNSVSPAQEHQTLHRDIGRWDHFCCQDSLFGGVVEESKTVGVMATESESYAGALAPKPK